jgi:hypothetical protein
VTDIVEGSIIVPDEAPALYAEITRLRAEVSELNQLFDAHWSADMRAIECWREVNPGNELVLPDHANLCLWLMEERTRLAAEVEKLRAALDEAQQAFALERYNAEKLRAALSPFASTKPDDGYDYISGLPDTVIVRCEASVREIKAARAALEEK